MHKLPHLTLGIETSCDETAAAVYHEKYGILSNALFSQIAIHKHFGGVVPELASRSQLEKINPIVATALKQAEITLDDIDVVAVTNRPGLPGSLLVGVCFAKAVAWSAGKKLIAVNHLVKKPDYIGVGSNIFRQVRLPIKCFFSHISIPPLKLEIVNGELLIANC